MIRVTDKQYWMHKDLKKNLDTAIYNAKRGFDIVIIVSGDGKTRVGKTMIAQQAGYYCGYRLNTPFTEMNMVFGGKTLMETALNLKKNSVIVDDESKEDFSSKSVLARKNKEIDTFFDECGKLNHIIILVATDYFDFNKRIAVNRSELLINVKRYSKLVKDDEGNLVVEFVRGTAHLFGSKKKKKLYMLSKSNFNDYDAVPYDAKIEFEKYWCINEYEYEKKKDMYLKRKRGEDEKEDKGFVISNLKNHPKTNTLTDEEIGKILGVSRMTIYRHKKKNVTSFKMP
jgi:hypothetical protein